MNSTEINQTLNIPHVEPILTNVENEEIDQKVNKIKNSKYFINNSLHQPKFYIKELIRCKRLFVIWLCFALICLSLITYGCISINNSQINNWAMLSFTPFVLLIISCSIIYTNNYLNFRNESKHANFTNEKLITINITKLYRRLKTAHININWLCSLIYLMSGLGILITYIVAWSCTFKWVDGPKWWILVDDRYTCGNTFLILVICLVALMFVTFFFHIYLIIANYIRISKIDQFYGTQIIDNNEIDLLKSKKNKRNAIIFFAITAILLLIVFLIYKIVRRKKMNNTTALV